MYCKVLLYIACVGLVNCMQINVARVNRNKGYSGIARIHSQGGPKKIQGAKPTLVDLALDLQFSWGGGAAILPRGEGEVPGYGTNRLATCRQLCYLLADNLHSYWLTDCSGTCILNLQCALLCYFCL